MGYDARYLAAKMIDHEHFERCCRDSNGIFQRERVAWYVDLMKDSLTKEERAQLLWGGFLVYSPKYDEKLKYPPIETY